MYKVIDYHGDIIITRRGGYPMYPPLFTGSYKDCLFFKKNYGG